MDEKALGKRLQLARKRAGLTQQELCQKAGLSYSTLAKIERGAIRSPSVFTVASIATATQTPLEDLLEMATQNAGSPSLTNAKKRSKSGITFVYFDVNGTLARFYERAFGAIEHDTHIAAEIVEAMYLHYDGAVCRGSMKNEEAEQIFASELNVPHFSWKKYYMEAVEATPGSAELVQWVAEHYEIGLLTNGWLGYTNELISRKIIPGVRYKTIVESAKVGSSKPEAKIYETAQELSGVPANELLLIDDRKVYLAGAEKAGWQTCLFEELHPEESIDRIKRLLEF